MVYKFVPRTITLRTNNNDIGRQVRLERFSVPFFLAKYTNLKRSRSVSIEFLVESFQLSNKYNINQTPNLIKTKMFITNKHLGFN